MIIAGNIKRTRLRLGLSRRMLASQLSTSPDRVSRIESGVSEPYAGELYSLGEIFNISIDDLYEDPVESALEGLTSCGIRALPNYTKECEADLTALVESYCQIGSPHKRREFRELVKAFAACCPRDLPGLDKPK